MHSVCTVKEIYKFVLCWLKIVWLSLKPRPKRYRKTLWVYVVLNKFIEHMNSRLRWWLSWELQDLLPCYICFVIVTLWDSISVFVTSCTKLYSIFFPGTGVNNSIYTLGLLLISKNFKHEVITQKGIGAHNITGTYW